MTGVLPRRAEDPLLLQAQDLRIDVPAVRQRLLHSPNLPAYHVRGEDRRRLTTFYKTHRRVVIVDSGRDLRRCSSSSIGWAVHGSFRDGGRRPAQRECGVLRARLHRAGRVLPRLRLRLDAHPRRLGHPHAVSGSVARRDGLDAREVSARWRLGACGPCRRRAARRRDRLGARDGVHPRRSRHLRRRGHRRLRGVARLGERGGRSDRSADHLRGRRRRVAASADLLPARLACAEEARTRIVAAASDLDDGVPARLLLRRRGSSAARRSGCCCALSARIRPRRRSSTSEV